MHHSFAIFLFRTFNFELPFKISIMTPQQYQRLSEAFLSALETPTSERTAWLSDVCGDDVEFRKRLERMLAADERSGIAIDQPICDAGFEILASQERGASEVAMVGQTVGKFQIIREIGGGGMGVVYEAMRSDLAGAKPVAVKIVKRGMDTDAVVRRFQLERRILAKFDHPYIAQFHDSGATDDGRPYFVMEYVAGQPIDEFCKTHRLSVVERLRLFCKVCEAVQYAHQNLIVHRDLKPGNILVATDATPKLLDFGIAKALISDFEHDDAFTHLSLTQTGRPILTPAYASPEQVRGEPITVATDIYSLGGLLYALLAGCPPHSFSNSSLDEIRRVVCEVEPEPPSKRITFQQSQTFGDDPPKKLRRLLSGDLDAIALTALRKDAQRRYATVEHLLADVRRYLNHLPVSARRDRFAYRIGKYVRRNRLRLTAGAVVALSVLGGTGVSVWQSARATAQAQASERRTEDLRQITGFLLSQFNDEMEKLPGSTKAREALVKESIKYLDRLDQEGGQSPAQRRELALGYLKLGDVQGNSAERASLGDFTGALASYRRALTIFEKLTDISNDDQTLVETGLALQKVGGVELLVSDPERAALHYERAIEIYRRLAAKDGNDRMLANLAACQVTSSEAGLELGEYERTFETLSEAEFVLQALAARHRDDMRFQYALALLYSKFVALFDAVGDIGKNTVGDADWVTAAYRRRLHYAQLASQIGERELNSEPNNLNTWRDHAGDVANVAAGLIKVQRAREALELLQPLTKNMERLTAKDEGNADFVFALAELRHSIGQAHIRLGKTDLAVDQFRTAFGICQRENFKGSPNIKWKHLFADVCESLADALLQAGKDGEAVPYLEEAFRARSLIRLAKSSSFPFNIKFAATFLHLANQLSQPDGERARAFAIQTLNECAARAAEPHATAAELTAFAWMVSACPVKELRNSNLARTYSERAQRLGGRSGEFHAFIAILAISQQFGNATKERAYESAVPPLLRNILKENDGIF
jgi:serine/threonine protein kinase